MIRTLEGTRKKIITLAKKGRSGSISCVSQFERFLTAQSLDELAQIVVDNLPYIVSDFTAISDLEDVFGYDILLKHGVAISGNCHFENSLKGVFSVCNDATITLDPITSGSAHIRMFDNASGLFILPLNFRCLIELYGYSTAIVVAENGANVLLSACQNSFASICGDVKCKTFDLARVEKYNHNGELEERQ